MVRRTSRLGEYHGGGCGRVTSINMEMKADLSIPKIDAHAHIPADHAESLEFLKGLGVQLFNISVADDDSGKWRSFEIWGADAFSRMVQQWPSACAWCTSFDAPRFDDPGYIEKVLDGLKRDFAAGAIACKVWKNIGKTVKKPSGEYIQVDDPLFDPVFDYLEKSGRTLVIHAADSLQSAKLHEEGGVDTPEKVAKRTEGPTHSEVMAARDRMVARHPKMRVIGCHLGSLDHDLKELAARLDRYPNFAVDTGARVMHLSTHDPKDVREFFDKYQDRILWGTDLFSETHHSKMDSWPRRKDLGYLRYRYLEEFAYYETAGEIEFHGWRLHPKRIVGLGLDGKVLEKYYRGNALEWIPGIIDKRP